MRTKAFEDDHKKYDFHSWIVYHMNLRVWETKELASRTGLDFATINRIVNGDNQNLHQRSIDSLESVFNCKIDRLTGFLDEPPEAIRMNHMKHALLDRVSNKCQCCADKINYETSTINSSVNGEMNKVAASPEDNIILCHTCDGFVSGVQVLLADKMTALLCFYSLEEVSGLIKLRVDAVTRIASGEQRLIGVDINRMIHLRWVKAMVDSGATQKHTKVA